jgi:hypothetical protein
MLKTKSIAAAALALKALIRGASSRAAAATPAAKGKDKRTIPLMFFIVCSLSAAI